ncbi:MAG: hypothetical protein ACQET5_14340 [Halobacteriota archaeon]
MDLDWLFDKDLPTYVYALFGGVVGILVVTGHNLFLGAESYYNCSIENGRQRQDYSVTV